MILYYFPIAQNTVNKTVRDFFRGVYACKFVQLVFVLHMQYMTKFYCNVSIACQYISILSDIFFIFMRRHF